MVNSVEFVERIGSVVFEPLTNYNLSDIYRNKKYIITDNKFYDFFNPQIFSVNL